MKDIMLHLHTSLVVLISVLSLTLTAAAAPNDIQHPLTKSTVISSPKEPVPGDNNAFYGPIPKASQIFDIRFLEIAPSPIPVNIYFFTLLRGSIPTSTKNSLRLTPAHLANATISVTLSAVLQENDEIFEPTTYTTPLRTAELAEGAQISIRNATGVYTEHMSLEGRNDILTNYWIPGMFVQTGTYTFEIVALLGEGDGDEKDTGKGACLFAVTVTQWLERRWS